MGIPWCFYGGKTNAPRQDGSRQLTFPSVQTIAAQADHRRDEASAVSRDTQPFHRVVDGRRWSKVGDDAAPDRNPRQARRATAADLSVSRMPKMRVPSCDQV